MKLNSDDKTLAESKVLILYIISKVGKPISHNELLDLVVSISDMNYFYFEQFLLDLYDDKFIIKYKNENDDEIYQMTDEGKKALNLTIDMIPGILKLEVDSKFKNSIEIIKDKFSISAEYTPINQKEFTVRLLIKENNQNIFDLSTHAGSKEQAKKIVDSWNNNATYIYPKILELLTDTIVDESSNNIDNNNHNNKDENNKNNNKRKKHKKK